MLYWFLKTFVVAPVMTTAFRPWVRGQENVPRSGAVIFAANHLALIDSIFLPLAVDRTIHFLVKSDYFTGTGVKGWILRKFFYGIGQLPIDRSGGRKSEAALDSGLKVLTEGKQLGIYPEGTRSPDGKLYRGRTGVARMILSANVPVVPVVMVGTDQLMASGRRIPRFRRVGVIFGEPLDFSRFEGLEGDRFVLRSITDEIMYELSRIGGQEYADVYASSVNKASGRGRPSKARAAARARIAAKPAARTAPAELG